LQLPNHHGAKLGPQEIAGKFDGYAETWKTESIGVKPLRELVVPVEKEEA